MHLFALTKRLIRFAVNYVVLFTLAFSLTIIPRTFAKQPRINSLAGFYTQTTKPSSTTPQQLVSQGEALYQSGRFAEAVTFLQQAVRIYQQQGDNLAQAAALTNLSLVFEQLGSWKEASKAINNSLNLLGWDNTNQKLNVNNPKSELLEVLAQTLEIQSGLQLSQGQADISLKTSQISEQIWKRLGKQYNAGVTRSRINQAQALRVSGFYRRSLDILNEVSQQLQTQPDSLEKVTALRSLGNVHRQLGDLEQSWKNLKHSLEIAQRLQLPLETSLTEFSLGNTARDLGNIKDAIAHYENAALIAPNSLTKVQAQINQLSLLVENEQVAQAKTIIPTIQSQLATLPTTQAGIYARINFARTISKIGNKKDIAEILANSVQQAKTIGDERTQSYALGSLAEVYEQNNQWLDAQKLTQEALFLAQKIDASDIAYRWEWLLGRLLKAQGNIEGAFVGDVGAAIAAYDTAVATLQSLRTDLVAVNREVQFNFRDSVEPIYRQSVELLLQQKGQEKPDLDKVRKRIEALQLAELDNFFREACLSNQFVVLDKVVDRDRPNTAIFYPIILDNQLEIILKLPNQPLIHKTSVVNHQQVEEAIAQMQETIVQPDANNKFQAVSQQLYDWLIKPVAGELKNSRVNTLVFIPDGSLRNIPMSALSDGKEYLVQKYAIAISPGLQLFTPKPLAQKKLNALVGGLSQPPRNEKFAPLPNVKVELELIQQSGISTTILLDENFKSTTLRKTINSQPFRVVHLATHGQFSSKAKDTFILAADKRIYVNELDSLLKSREQKRTQPVELLVLSACETAQGDNRAALGLAGVALRAGARSTLASLWQIGDESTALFVSEFYHQLTTGKTTAEALREAQLKLLSSSQYTRPLYWATYVLVGNWL
ncbi:MULTISPECIES: CHAT domain-containing protein [unclassified Nostoc]|uniref:CHAT domain-containing protein n=1 Tax=unclassified Nostoc TaxID=2593658 RepID=UPI002AD353FA|nr:CHAT domain-containing protein [Nostoc sp. DedQUE03]MDZ7977194.1 CHAT domain-containing protein [Nostoc sp. DedQUE03]MDZ8042722.1 CHAT domain-containing protein [Nostoc sp. DedQUE02]